MAVCDLGAEQPWMAGEQDVSPARVKNHLPPLPILTATDLAAKMYSAQFSYYGAQGEAIKGNHGLLMEYILNRGVCQPDFSCTEWSSCVVYG